MTSMEEKIRIYRETVIGSELAKDEAEMQVHMLNLRVLLQEYKNRSPFWVQMLGDGRHMEAYALQMEFSKKFMEFMHRHFTDDFNVSTMKYPFSLMDLRLFCMAQNMVYQMKVLAEENDNTDENGDRPEDIRVPEGVSVN